MKSCSASGGATVRARKLLEELADKVTVKIFVVGLIAVIEQTFVAGLAATVGPVVSQSDRIEVTKLQRAPCQRGDDRWVFNELPQNPRSTFRGFVEKKLHSREPLGDLLSERAIGVAFEVERRCLQTSRPTGGVGARPLGLSRGRGPQLLA